jgi:signal peptidase I
VQNILSKDVSKPRARRTERTPRTPRSGSAATAPTRKERFRENVRFWVTTLLIVLFIRAFFFEAFRIPTPSMERSLLVGDFLFVSKLHYGARTPETIGIPFTGIYAPGIRLPQTRLPGFSSVKRGDVAVFNYPPDLAPVERKTPYIKRIVALPGDQISLLDKMLYIDGEAHPLTPTMMQHWGVTPVAGADLPLARLRDFDIEYVGELRSPRKIVVNAAPGAVDLLRGLPYVADVEPFVIPEGMMQQAWPEGSQFNRDNYGPITVPARGASVQLTQETWPVVRDIINRYEGREARVGSNGGFLIDGQPATSYTFGQDYYFAMGDNRDNSEDSRFWGYVPHDHLVGKAVILFFSIDMERYLPRLGRIFNIIR